MDLYDAKIDGIALDIQSIDDGWEKAIAEYEFPYRDGAETEDLGQRARRVRLRCYFWDDFATHNTYTRHVDLLNHLKSQELFELIHPQYGPMKGRIKSISVRHDDRVRLAEIDIEFVEEMPTGNIRAIPYRNVRAACELSYFQILTAAILAVKSRIDSLSRLITTPIKRITAGIEQCISAFDATLASIASPANSIVFAIEYGTDLPDRLVESIAKCSERYGILYETFQDAPNRYINSLSASLTSLSTTFPGSTITGTDTASRTAISIVSLAARIAGAAHLAHETASLYQDDQEVWQARKSAESTQAFDALGNYTPADIDQVMTVRELEQSLADVRSVIQAAIDEARASEAVVTEAVSELKSSALQLERHVASVKLERENLVAVDLDNPMPMHLVCLRYGLDYHAAERLVTVNPQVRNPNQASGEVYVYVR